MQVDIVEVCRWNRKDSVSSSCSDSACQNKAVAQATNTPFGALPETKIAFNLAASSAAGHVSTPAPGDERRAAGP